MLYDTDTHYPDGTKVTQRIVEDDGEVLFFIVMIRNQDVIDELVLSAVLRETQVGYDTAVRKLDGIEWIVTVYDGSYEYEVPPTRDKFDEVVEKYSHLYPEINEQLAATKTLYNL